MNEVKAYMKKSTSFMIFIIGVAVGSIFSWQYAKKKYAQIGESEIESLKAAFSGKASTNETSNNSSSHACTNEKELKNYTNDSDFKLDREEQESVLTKPYVISPEEFGGNDDYEKISLSYYADHVLADENDELVENADEVIGMDSLTHFGEYEDDSVFVRNDMRKCDYEILINQQTYFDVIKKKPHRMEV